MASCSSSISSSHGTYPVETYRITSPPAFVCTYSKVIMKDPILSLCSHLFDSSVLNQRIVCPLDQMPVVSANTVKVPHLKSLIDRWFKENLLSEQPESNKSEEAPFIEPVRKDFNELKIFSPIPERPGLLSYAKVADLKGKSGNGNVFSSPSSSSSSGTIPLQQHPAPANRFQIKPYYQIKNSHDDDIHGFLSISDRLFVSGSKDNKLKVWSKETGELTQSLIPSASEGGYEFWVTALAQLNNSLWASGTRDGRVIIWDLKGKELITHRYFPNGQHICKQRNKSRINCMTSLDSRNESTVRFYTGAPENIHLWEYHLGNKVVSCVRRYFARPNDWVYCIEVLENKDLVVVIGSDLEYWKMKGLNVDNKTSLIEETKSKKAQRPHISAITRLTHNTRYLASALFDGSVKVMDIDSGKIIQDYQEHRKRVWSVVNLRDHLFASSADDKTIRVWDVRQKESCLTLRGNPGRVSSLLKISDHVLISGSCPDDIQHAHEKACISFWDIRQIVELIGPD